MQMLFIFGFISTLMSLNWSVFAAVNGTYYLAAFFATAALSIITVAFYYLRYRSYVIAAHLTMAVSFFGTNIANIMTGGLRGTNVTAYYTVFVAAIFLLGKQGLFWAIPAILCAIVIQVLMWMGVSFPDGVPPETRDLDSFLTWLTSASLVLLFLFFYESTRAQTMSQYRILNEALQLSENKKRIVADRLGILHNISQQVIAAQSPIAVADAVLGNLMRLLPCRGILILQFRKESGCFSVLVSDFEEELFFQGEEFVVDLNSPFIKQLSPGRIVEIDSSKIGPHFVHFLSKLGQLHFNKSYCLPLHFENDLIGLICIAQDEQSRFSQDHVSIVQEVGESLAVAMYQAQLREKLQFMNETLVQERSVLADRVKERTVELQKVNEELVQASRMKDVFMANMSHELRTPLNTILGMTESLMTRVYGKLLQEQIVAVDKIDESGKHLLFLINDILDLATLESGGISIAIEPTDMVSLCKKSLDHVSKKALEKKVKLFFTETRETMIVGVDPHRMTQVLINLLLNALKFTDAGGSIGLELDRDTKKKNITISVWDTGIGIAKEHFEEIFQPFRQLETSYTKKHAGTGLGLTLVKQITELHDGRVAVTSTLGEGSRFTIHIPDKMKLRETEPSKAPLDSKTTIYREKRLPAKVICLLGDPELGNMISSVLTSCELSFLSPEHLSNLHRLLANVKPDLVIIEWPRDGEFLMANYLEILRSPEREVILIGGKEALAELPQATYVPPDCRAVEFAQVINHLFPETYVPEYDGASSDEQIKILLAEDNPSNVKTFSDYLSSKGFHIIVAQNGVEAINLTRQYEPQVILMDIQMPVKNGIDAIRGIRDLELNHQPRIIVITGIIVQGNREKCMESGADAYLTKPISLHQLHTVISRYS